MSEFGNDTASVTIRLEVEMLKSLRELLKYLAERSEKKIDKELKKENLKKVRSDGEIRKIRGYLNEKNGNVSANMLYKSGEKLIPISVSLSTKELRKFEEYSKIYGLVYTSISDKNIGQKIKQIKKEIKQTDDKETKDRLHKQLTTLEKQRQKRIVIIREKDLAIAKDITDRLNKDIKLRDVDKNIEVAKEAGDNDLVLNLEKEREKITNMAKDFNAVSNNNVFAKQTGEKYKKEYNFNNAINMITDRSEINKPIIICERLKPSNYIQAISLEQETEEGKYISTEFKVFKENTEQKCDEFKHGKFTHYTKQDMTNSSERGLEHWENMKKEMKNKGNFSDDLLMFNSKEDYTKYVEKLKETEKTINREDVLTYEGDINSYTDCMGIINNLSGQLAEHNMLMQAGQLCNANKEVVYLNKNATDDEKTEYAENFNIAKRIGNYNDINKCQNELEMKKFGKEQDNDKYKQVKHTEETDKIHEQSQQKYDKEISDLEKELAGYNVVANKLINEYKQIQSVKVVGIIEKERELDSETLTEVTEENTHGEEISHTMEKEQWEKNIGNNKTTIPTNTETLTEEKTIE